MTTWEKWKQVMDNFMDDEVFTRSASLAYYMALTVAPLVILIVWLFSILNLDLQVSMINDVATLVGTDAAKLVETIMQAANERPDLSSMSGWLALTWILISASIVFSELQTSLEKIFSAVGEKAPEMSTWQMITTYVVSRFFSIGMLLTCMFIAIVSLIISSFVSYYIQTSVMLLVQVLNFTINCLIFAVLFGLIYRWLPRKSISYQSAFVAGFLTSVLFNIGKIGIGFYIGKAALGSAYGAAGSIVIFLVWVFYSAVIFFFSAEVAYVFVVDKAEEPILEDSKTKRVSSSYTPSVTGRSTSKGMA